jgi:hypothetical protein
MPFLFHGPDVVIDNLADMCTVLIIVLLFQGGNAFTQYSLYILSYARKPASNCHVSILYIRLNSNNVFCSEYDKELCKKVKLPL